MVWALWVIARRTGLSAEFAWQRTRRFFLIGRDLALRTGFAQIFMLVSTLDGPSDQRRGRRGPIKPCVSYGCFWPFCWIPMPSRPKA